MTQTTENSAWPVRSILLWGTFGPETVAGRQFQRRCMWALILMVVGQVAAAFAAREWFPLYWPVACVAFTYIGREWWRYLASLDELERRLQVEAAAWTYMVGLVAALALAGLQQVVDARWVNPGLLVLLELVRAFRLRALVRRLEA